LVSAKSLFVIKHPKVRSFINVDQESQLLQSRDTYPITGSNSHIFMETEPLRGCKLSYDKSSRWRYCLREPEQPSTRRYLEPNDYIYFVHSEDNSIVSVDSSNNITFKLRDHNQ